MLTYNKAYDILDQVHMTSLNEKVKKVAASLVAVLNQRNRDILSRRFGLKTGRRETLESIGQSYKITRERVRQIEDFSLKQIHENFGGDLSVKVKPIVALAENVLNETNGVAREDYFYNGFFGVKGSGSNKANPVANACLAFIVTISGKMKKFAEDQAFYNFWALSDDHARDFKASVASFNGGLNKHNGVVNESELPNFLKKQKIELNQPAKASLVSYFAPAKSIGKNIFNEIGLTSWPEIKPRGVKDKSYLVLKKDGKPKHFAEIAGLISKMGLSEGKANIQTVHNELIKDKRFVLVGRGTYALAEWGYKAGTVRDVVIDLFKTANKPLPKGDIIAHVLSHRMVKENTILLSLQDSKVFNKKGNGVYELKEA